MATELVEAIYRRPLASIRELLELGADLNVPADDGDGEEYRAPPDRRDPGVDRRSLIAGAASPG